jgi:hypothetical protein
MEKNQNSNYEPLFENIAEALLTCLVAITVITPILLVFLKQIR